MEKGKQEESIVVTHRSYCELKKEREQLTAQLLIEEAEVFCEGTNNIGIVKDCQMKIF